MHSDIFQFFFSWCSRPANWFHWHLLRRWSTVWETYLRNKLLPATWSCKRCKGEGQSTRLQKSGLRMTAEMPVTQESMSGMGNKGRPVNPCLCPVARWPLGSHSVSCPIRLLRLRLFISQCWKIQPMNLHGNEISFGKGPRIKAHKGY